MTIDSYLKQHGHRTTEARREIFRILLESSQPLAAKEIIYRMRIGDKTSAYRTLELFTTLSIVTNIPVGWKPHYELADPFKAHHHHLHCQRCGVQIDIHSHAIEKLIATTASQHNFQPISHHFEISGYCSNCHAL